MATTDDTRSILHDLDVIDAHEDLKLAGLLERADRLDDVERRSRILTVDGLGALNDGLSGLEKVIDDLQARVAWAAAAGSRTAPVTPPPAPVAATPPAVAPQTPTVIAPQAPVAQPAPPAAAQPAQPAAAAPPPPTTTNGGSSAPTFAQLAATIREQNAQSDGLRAQFLARFSELEAAVGSKLTPVVPGVPQPPVPVKRTLHVTDPLMQGKDVLNLQRALNVRFEDWHIGKRISEHGRFGPQTDHAARQVARGLGIAAEDYEHGITPAVRALIADPRPRTRQQLALAKSRDPWLDNLRDQYRSKRPNGTARKHGRTAGHMPRRTPGRMSAPMAQSSPMATRINAKGGRWGELIVRESKRSGLSPALICAVIDAESAFTNVFGHDRVSNPVKSPPRPAPDLAVTKDLYLSYLKHRSMGEGNQGVGPMQLTSPDLQDHADKLGGAWMVSHNVRVGCETLAGHIRDRGRRAGIQRYNGAKGFGYADNILKLEAKWQQRLHGASTVSPGVDMRPRNGVGGGGHPGMHPTGTARTFRVKKVAMHGNDIKSFQRLLNKHFAAWGIDIHVTEDGEYGRATKLAARRVARGLGIAPADHVRGFSPAVRRLIADPNRRTTRQRQTAKANAAWLAALKKRHRVAGGVMGGSLRERAYAQAKKLVGVHEVGENGGKTVDMIIAAAGGKRHEAWCGDFLAYCYRHAGSKSVSRSWAAVRLYLPMTGLKATKDPRKGNLVRYSKPEHIGMFVAWCDSSGKEVSKAMATHIKTIEGNTTSAGALSPIGNGREGVYMKLRPKGMVRDYIHVMR